MKLIGMIIWVVLLGLSMAFLAKGLIDGDVQGIRWGLGATVLSVITLAAIVEE
jgi:hypothetical protein